MLRNRFLVWVLKVFVWRPHVDKLCTSLKITIMTTSVFGSFEWVCNVRDRILRWVYNMPMHYIGCFWRCVGACMHFDSTLLIVYFITLSKRVFSQFWRRYFWCVCVIASQHYIAQHCRIAINIFITMLIPNMLGYELTQLYPARPQSAYDRSNRFKYHSGVDEVE